MAELKTNFNVAPFYDDYDEDKQYYRILFRPATAVQARELTQIQTMMQKQVSRFADSIYKDGTIIQGCTFRAYPNIKQIKFKDSNTSTLDFATLSIDITDVILEDANTPYSSSNTYLLVSNTTGLRAALFRAYTGTEPAAPDTNRAYVIYLNSGTGGVSEFSQTSEKIDVYSSVQDKSGPLSLSNQLGSIYTLSSNATVNALGVGYGLYVKEGIVYQKGFFVKVLPYKFIVKEHSSNAAGMRVGFDTTESIVRETQDESLYDNSLGSTNYSAPGAWRLKLKPTPVFYDVSNTQVVVPNNFFAVMEFDGGDGRIVVNKNTPQLSTLGDTLATRQFETNGDFIVKPFQVDVVAHESNNYSFYYNASPGIAYVDGYRVEFQSPRRIEVPRGIDTKSSEDTLVTKLGNYYYVNECVGILDTSDYIEVDLYDTPQQTLSIYQTRSSPSGTAVGKANVRALKYLSGTKGTPQTVYQLYVFNIRLNAGKTTDNIKSFYHNNATYGKFYADVIPDPVTGKYTIYEPKLSKPLYDTGYTGVKRFTSNTGVNGTSLFYRQLLTASLASVSGGSTATFTIPGPDEFGFGPGYLDDTTSLDLNLMFAQDSFSNVIITTANIASSNSTTSNVTSTSNFSTYLTVGDYVAITNTISSTTNYGYVRAINSSNSITISPASALGAGSHQLKQFFKKGTSINFTGSGNTIFEDNALSLTINMTFDPQPMASYSITGTIPVYRSPASAVTKEVNKGMYVKIDPSSHWYGVTGPWNLGVSDVIQVTNVFVGATYSVTNPDRRDWFILDNGQRDTHYDIARLSIDPSYAGSITTADKLLVKFDYLKPSYSSTKGGFFTVESYPIDDANTANTDAIQTAQIPIYTDTTGIIYDLRNYIDMRPLKANTATSTNNISLATINPSNNVNTFITSATPVVIDPDSNFNYNIEYYLPRRDILLLTRNSSLEVKQGEPSKDPVPSPINRTGLPIAEIFVPPYPSLTFTEAE